jgi:hypothetical protein
MKLRRRIGFPRPGDYADLDELQQGFTTNGMGLGVSLHSSNHKLLMSALGQKQTLRRVSPMSAIPPKADIGHDSRIPLCAITNCAAAKNCSLFDHPIGGESSVCSTERPNAAPTSVAHRCQPNSGRLEGGFLSTRTSSLTRCNNRRAVACFNFSLFHFCHTLVNSSSRSREQTEQIL